MALKRKRPILRRTLRQKKSQSPRKGLGRGPHTDRKINLKKMSPESTTEEMRKTSEKDPQRGLAIDAPEKEMRGDTAAMSADTVTMISIDARETPTEGTEMVATGEETDIPDPTTNPPRKTSRKSKNRMPRKC